MTDQGEQILEDMRRIVDASTWLVCFRSFLKPNVIYRGRHPENGRGVIFAHPCERERLLAGLEKMHLPHELEDPDGTA